MARKRAIEMALRMVKYGVGERIWMDEHNIHPESDLDAKEVAASERLAREIELRNIKTSVSSRRDNCTIHVTAMVARTLSDKTVEKVVATAKLEKWDGAWWPMEVDIENFRREQCSFDFDGIEESSIPPLLPEKPRRASKVRSIVVTLEQFIKEMDRDQLLIRISGGHSIGGSGGQNDFYIAIIGIGGVDEAIITPQLVGIEKDDDAEWSSILPTLREKLTEFFGADVKIIERTCRSMPEEDGMFLGEAEGNLIRSAMRGCALTEDEREAIGMSRSEYEAGLEE